MSQLPKVARQYLETSLQDEVEEKDKNDRRKEERGKTEGRKVMGWMALIISLLLGSPDVVHAAFLMPWVLLKAHRGPVAGMGWGKGNSKSWRTFLLFQSSLSLLPILGCLTKKLCDFVCYRLELESRAVVPAQTDQIPIGSSRPLLDQLNWNCRGLGQGIFYYTAPGDFS